MHTQGCQGCQKIRNLLRNSKILIARSTIQPKLSKIKKTLRNASIFIKNWQMVFDFTQFWLDGRPGNDYFWISHKISGLLTSLTPLGVHPQWFETTVWNRYEWFLQLWQKECMVEVESNQFQSVFISILIKYCCLFDGIFVVGWSAWKNCDEVVTKFIVKVKVNE